MADGTVTPGQYEQDLSAAIDQLQSLSGDFSRTANDLQLVGRNLRFDVTGIADIAGAAAPAPSGRTSPGADFYYGKNGGGYRACTEGQLGNLDTLVKSLGDMANGLLDAARQLQQREDDAVKAFGNLLPPPPPPPTTRVRPLPEVV
jgi:hypothetical protein